MFCPVNKGGKVSAEKGMSLQAIAYRVVRLGQRAGLGKLSPHAAPELHYLTSGAASACPRPKAGSGLRADKQQRRGVDVPQFRQMPGAHRPAQRTHKRSEPLLSSLVPLELVDNRADRRAFFGVLPPQLLHLGVEWRS